MPIGLLDLELFGYSFVDIYCNRAKTRLYLYIFCICSLNNLRRHVAKSASRIKRPAYKKQLELAALRACTHQ